MSVVAVPADVSGFRTRFPVDLRIGNVEGEAAIRLLDADAAGEQLHLSLENRSAKPFTMSAPDGGAPPRPSNYHIELRFRPGILDPARLGEVQVVHTDAAEGLTGTWELAHMTNRDLTVSFFLVRDRAVRLNYGERLHLALTNVQAHPAAISSTTLVESLVRRDPARSRRFIEADFHRIDRVRLIGRRGKPKLALAASWLGSDTILNDGKSGNNLVLELMNGGRDPIDFDARGLDDRSTLILSASGTGDDDPARLASANHLAGTEVRVDDPDAGWVVRREDEGVEPRWLMRPLDPRRLEPGQSLRVMLSGLVSDASSGTAHLTLEHRNVPGHWDGRLVLELRKAPLLFSRPFVNRRAARDRVGIHTLAPELDLSLGRPDVGLQTDVGGVLGLYTAGVRRLAVHPGGQVRVSRGDTDDAGVDLAIGSESTGLRARDDGGLTLRAGGTDLLDASGGGNLMIPKVDGVGLGLGDWHSGIAGGSDRSISLVTRNTARLVVGPEGTIHLGDINVQDTLRITGRGDIVTLSNLAVRESTWALKIVAGGTLVFQPHPAGRGAEPVMDLLADGKVVTRELDVEGALSAQRLIVGGVSLEARHLRALVNLVDHGVRARYRLRLNDFGFGEIVVNEEGAFRITDIGPAS